MKRAAFLLAFAVLASCCWAQGAPGEGNKATVDTSKGRMLHMGWLKYFSYDVDQKNKPNDFFVNKLYGPTTRVEAVPGMDQFGPNGIPSDRHFFFMLNDKNLYVAQTRNSLQEVVGALEIMKIDPVQLGPPITGGVEDQGFFEEGYCFQVKSIGMQGEHEIWVLCADNPDSKSKWMTTIALARGARGPGGFGTITIKDGKPGRDATSSMPIQATITPLGSTPPILEQVIKQMVPAPEGPVLDGMTVKGNIPSTNLPPPPPAPPVDGQWIITQDWGVCSAPCGGGTQIRKRVCIPPQNGGKPCVGDPMETRACNQQACAPPVVNAPPQYAPAQVVVMPVMAGPSRYVDCVIKEGNLEVEKTINDQKAKVPVHVVLNNKTITIFENENIDTMTTSFDLPEVVAKTYQNAPDKCFALAAPRENKMIVLCAPSVLSRPSQSEVREWIRDIEHFRHDCLDLLLPGGKKPANQMDPDFLQAKLGELQKQYMEKKAEELDDARDEEAQNNLDKEVEKAAAEALSAVQKEIEREQMEEREELAREAAEQKLAQQHLAAEEKKAQCIRKQIERKRRIADKKKHQLEIQHKIDQIKNEATQQLKLKRQASQNKMKALQNSAQRAKSEITQKIEVYRAKMAEEMMNAEKEGDENRCFVTNANDRGMYCRNSFHDNAEKYQTCLATVNSDGDFCDMCCSEEFGELLADKREICSTKCANGGVDPADITIGDKKCEHCLKTAAGPGMRLVPVPDTNSVKRF